MKKTFLLLPALVLAATTVFPQGTFIKITLDTKLMISADYSLGGGNGNPSLCTKVYAHLGLCTCDLDWDGTKYVRDCSNTDSNKFFCLSQIIPYKSKVWEHVVGNWGSNPQDDGIGLMTTLGDGVYSIEFVIQEYFSDHDLVNTDYDPNDPQPFASTVWDPNDGGAPYTIGMVFRNEDGSKTGRDDMGSDLFIINLTGGNPKVVQGYEVTEPFPAISFLTGTGEINNEVHYVSAYPNPFSESVKIIYTLTQQTKYMKIAVYNTLGQEVKVICNGAQASGSHTAYWDGTSDSGTLLQNGIYYYSLIADGKVIASDKIVIARRN